LFCFLYPYKIVLSFSAKHYLSFGQWNPWVKYVLNAFFTPYTKFHLCSKW
jgi:hypothetical protein